MEEQAKNSGSGVSGDHDSTQTPNVRRVQFARSREEGREVGEKERNISDI